MIKKRKSSVLSEKKANGLLFLSILYIYSQFRCQSSIIFSSLCSILVNNQNVKQDEEKICQIWQIDTMENLPLFENGSSEIRFKIR